MFEVSAEETIALAQPLGLRCVLDQEAEPSLRQPGVSWSRLAFRNDRNAGVGETHRDAAAHSPGANDRTARDRAPS